MKLEFDFSEFDKFQTNLQNLTLLEDQMKNAVKRLAKAMLRWMKEYTPVDEYKLINGWGGNKFAVTKNGDVLEVLIVNKTPYALAVNDGHMVHNGSGGPYKVKRRIQVRSPHQWQKDASEWYVYGHFFVERGILRLCNTKEVEQIIMDELQKWWEKC